MRKPAFYTGYPIFPFVERPSIWTGKVDYRKASKLFYFIRDIGRSFLIFFYEEAIFPRVEKLLLWLFAGLVLIRIIVSQLGAFRVSFTASLRHRFALRDRLFAARLLDLHLFEPATFMPCYKRSSLPEQIGLNLLQ